MLQKNKKNFIAFSLAAGALFLLAAALFYFYAFRLDEGRLDESRPTAPAAGQAIDKRLQSLLQEKTREVLSEYIALKRPDIQRFEFHRIQAKAVSLNKVKMFLSYTLSTDKKETEAAFSADAEAWLTRENPDDHQWILSGFQVKESLLDFAEPFLIKPSLLSPPFKDSGSDSSPEEPRLSPAGTADGTADGTAKPAAPGGI